MNKSPKLPTLICLLIALFVAASTVNAQATTFTISGNVKNANGQPLADVTMLLLSDVTGTQITFTDQNGHYAFTYAGGVSHTLHLIPSKTGFIFNPLGILFISSSSVNGDKLVEPPFEGSQLPLVLPVLMPVLLTQENSLRALALDSVTRISEPFGVANTNNFSSDQRTRISLFAVNVAVNAGENPASIIEAEAENSLGQVFPLTLEHFGAVPNFAWLKHIVLKLPNEIANSNEVRVSLKVRGIAGNKVTVKVKP